MWCVGAVLPMAAGGGHGSSCLRRIMFFCSDVFCQEFRRGKGFRSGCWLPVGVPWGRGARVEVGQVWFVGGVVPMTAGGMGPRAFTASCPFALLSFARAPEGERASDRAAGCSWGVPWGRGACDEVRQVWFVGGVVPMAAGGMGPSCFRRIMFSCSGVFCQGFRRSKGFRSSCWLLLESTMGWLCGTAMSTSAADEDLDEEEMGLVRTEGPGLSPLECSSAAEVQISI